MYSDIFIRPWSMEKEKERWEASYPLGEKDALIAYIKGLDSTFDTTSGLIKAPDGNGWVSNDYDRNIVIWSRESSPVYTIKSVSDEGTYYLCNHWKDNKTFWMEKDDFKPCRLFKSPGLAKRSLKQLLKMMEDYCHDDFSVVKIEHGEIQEIESFEVLVEKRGLFEPSIISITYC